MTEKSYRVLWAEVVLQAKADLEQEPIGSILYHHAESFFVGSGEWAESRAIVAECLDIPSITLYRRGKDWIAARRAREGLPPEPPQVPRPVPLPRLVALPGPGPYVGRHHRIRTPRETTRLIRFGSDELTGDRHWAAAATATSSRRDHRLPRLLPEATRGRHHSQFRFV